MKISFLKTAAIVILAFGTSTGVLFGGEVKKNERQPVQVTLKIADSNITQGELPEYSITLKNISDGTILILNVKKRIDFRSVYCDLHIHSLDRKIELPTAYSHSGPIGDSDFVSLKTNESLKYVSKAELFSSKNLVPGRYEAYVIFWANPYDYKSTIKSNVVSFSVKKKSEKSDLD